MASHVKRCYQASYCCLLRGSIPPVWFLGVSEIRSDSEY